MAFKDGSEFKQSSSHVGDHIRYVFRERINKILSSLREHGLYEGELRRYFESGTGKNYLDLANNTAPNLVNLIKLKDLLQNAYNDATMAEQDILYLLDMRAEHSQPGSATRDVVVRRNNGISWLRFLPDYTSDEEWQRTISELRRGVQFFEETIETGMTLKAYVTKYGEDPVQICREFRRALWANAIQIYQVTNCDDKANLLRNKFQLRDVLVAQLPKSQGNNYIDATVIRTEIVSQLAAHVILNNYSLSRYFGIGSGYTLERFCFHTVTNSRQFFHWIPLQVFVSEHDEPDPRSSNSLVTILRSTYLNSQSESLPFILPEDRQFVRTHGMGLPKDNPYREQQIKLAAKVNDAWNALTSIVTSVSGHEIRGESQYYLPGSDGDEYSFPAVENLYHYLEIELESEGKSLDNFGGEILGHFLDRHGQPIGSKQVNDIQMETLFSISRQQLINLTRTKCRTWCLAAGSHKKDAVLAAIRGGYVNCLVIDEDIADYLIALPLQDKF